MEREFHQINDPAGPFDDGRELEPIEDAIGQDLFQAYLEAAYSVYLTRCYQVPALAESADRPGRAGQHWLESGAQDPAQPVMEEIT